MPLRCWQPRGNRHLTSHNDCKIIQPTRYHIDIQFSFPSGSVPPKFPPPFCESSPISLSSGSPFTPTGSSWDLLETDLDGAEKWLDWDAEDSSASVYSTVANPCARTLSASQQINDATSVHQIPCNAEDPREARLTMSTSGGRTTSHYCKPVPFWNFNDGSQLTTPIPSAQNSKATERPPSVLEGRTRLWPDTMSIPPTRFQGSEFSTTERESETNTSSQPFSTPTPLPLSIPFTTSFVPQTVLNFEPMFSKPWSRPLKSRLHGNTEHKYRMRINDAFAELLEALPKDLLLASGHISEGLALGKAISKIEVLDLAKRRIEALEKEQAEMQEENLVLRRQLDLFKSLVVGLGSHISL